MREDNLAFWKHIKSKLNNFYLKLFRFFFFLLRHVEERPFYSLAVALEDPINNTAFHTQNILFGQLHTLSISSHLNTLSFILIASRRDCQLGTNDFNKPVQHLVIFTGRKYTRKKAVWNTDEEGRVKVDVGVTPRSELLNIWNYVR